MRLQVGGYDGASRQCLSSVECYNPETDSWRPVSDMCSRRSGAGWFHQVIQVVVVFNWFFLLGVGVLDGILYAVGGHDGPLVRKSVEAFDPTKDEVLIWYLLEKFRHSGWLRLVDTNNGYGSVPT